MLSGGDKAEGLFMLSQTNTVAEYFPGFCGVQDCAELNVCMGVNDPVNHDNDTMDFFSSSTCTIYAKS